MGSANAHPGSPAAGISASVRLLTANLVGADPAITDSGMRPAERGGLDAYGERHYPLTVRYIPGTSLSFDG